MTGPDDRTTPTVIVSRRPAPGRSRDFERWMRRLVAAAQRFPGYRASDIQPPDDVHPAEWVVVYEFVDGETLRGWLDSPERAALLDEGSELVLGEAKEQVVALDDSDQHVTAVASFRVRPGAEPRYAELHRRLVERLAMTPGYLRSELFEPVPGVQDDTVVVFSFDSRDHLDAWLGSDDRRIVLDEIDDAVAGDRTINVVGGFGGWFASPGAVEVKRWKQALVVLLALFPTTLVLTAVRDAVLPDVHWVVGVLIGNVLGVAVLSWILMPFLTGLLAGWLRR